MALHPAATVVRAGSVRDVATLLGKVQEAIEDGDGACISLFADISKTGEEDGMSLQELCRVSEIPHNKIQVSTAGRLQNSGFDIALDVSNDQAATHHSLTFTEPVEESELEKFIRCFDEPIPNPTPKRKPR